MILKVATVRINRNVLSTKEQDDQLINRFQLSERKNHRHLIKGIKKPTWIRHKLYEEKKAEPATTIAKDKSLTIEERKTRIAKLYRDLMDKVKSGQGQGRYVLCMNNGLKCGWSIINVEYVDGPLTPYPESKGIDS